MTLAVFDVDGTLLQGDSLLRLAHQLNPGVRWIWLSLRFLPTWLLHRVHLLSAAAVKERFLALFITTYPHLDAWVQEPFRESLLSWLRPEALARLRWHQSQGHRVILCSASPRFYLQPLADALGAELVATELHRRGDSWLPHLASSNCKGAEKVRRLEAYVGTLHGLQIEVYGDTKGDKELLQRADVPHYRSFVPQPRPYPLTAGLSALLPIVGLVLVGYGLAGVWSQGNKLLPLLTRLWPTITLGLVLVLIGYAIRFLRWRLLLDAVGQRPPWLADARIWMGSYAFTATPGKSGEALRSLLLREEWGIPAPPTLMGLVVERLTDGTAVLLLMLLNLPLLLRWQIPVAALVTGGLMGLTLLVALLRSARFRRMLKNAVLHLLPKRLAAATGDSLEALRALLKPTLLLQATVIGALAWSLEGISLALLLQAIGIPGVPWGGAIIAHTAAGLVGALTMLPGGLGSTEVGTVSLLALQGVPLSAATSATLLIRLMTLWFATALGVICLLLPSRR